METLPISIPYRSLSAARDPRDKPADKLLARGVVIEWRLQLPPIGVLVVEPGINCCEDSAFAVLSCRHQDSFIILKHSRRRSLH